MSKSTSNAQLSDGEMAKNHTFAIGIKRDAKILKKILNIPLHQAQQNLLDKAGFVTLSEMYQTISRRIQYYLQSSFFSFNKKDNSISVGVHEINQEAFLDPNNIIHIFTVGFDLKERFAFLPVVHISEYSFVKSEHIQYVVVDSQENFEKYSKILQSIAMLGRSMNARLLVALPSVVKDSSIYEVALANSNVLIAPKESFSQLTGMDINNFDSPLSKYCPFIAYTLSVGPIRNVGVDYFLKA